MSLNVERHISGMARSHLTERLVTWVVKKKSLKLTGPQSAAERRKDRAHGASRGKTRETTRAPQGRKNLSDGFLPGFSLGERVDDQNRQLGLNRMSITRMGKNKVIDRRIRKQKPQK